MAHHFGPDEPDMKALKGVREGEDLTERQQRTAMKRPGLFGRVWASFQTLNPETRPTILFAPGVPESIWFAEQFTAKGIRAAHLDGQHVWIDGELHPTTRELRQEILAESRKGRVHVLCNRFVLREGIDCPWLAHAIFATVFGSLQSYLQSGGRLLRAFPGLDHVTVQDHGGNWWRHGSLNADRLWSLDDTASSVYGLRAERLRSGKSNEPRRCPYCSRIITRRNCFCGYIVPEGAKRSRPVVTEDGSLTEMVGDIFAPRSVCKRPDGPKLWEKMYHRSCTKKGDRTFNAAMALFAMENNWQWPSREWPLMPREDVDLFRHVADVPRERLIQR
jgi:superfamily II DNA or RNA helicase